MEYRNEKGELHRTDGPAITRRDGTEYWYLNGQFHREAWYLNGKLHRTDGPTITRADGYKAWYINGIQLSKKQFDIAKKILKDPKWEDIPLHINDELLKPLIEAALKES